MKFFKMLLSLFLVLGIAACSTAPSYQELETAFLDRLKGKTLVYADGEYKGDQFGRFTPTGDMLFREILPFCTWTFMETPWSYGDTTPRNEGLYVRGLDHTVWTLAIQGEKVTLQYLFITCNMIFQD